MNTCMFHIVVGINKNNKTEDNKINGPKTLPLLIPQTTILQPDLVPS